MSKEDFMFKAFNSISKGRTPMSKEDFDENSYDPFMMVTRLSNDPYIAYKLKDFDNKTARNAPKYAHYLALFYDLMGYKYARKYSLIKVPDKYKKDEIESAMMFWDTSKEKAIEILDDLNRDDINELVDHCKKTGILKG